MGEKYCNHCREWVDVLPTGTCAVCYEVDGLVDGPEPEGETGDPRAKGSNDRGPEGIGGWLILVVIGLVFTPVRLLITLAEFLPVFTDGTWEALTSPGEPNYDPLWSILLVYELVVNIVMFSAFVGLLILFFNQSKRFPRLFIVVAITNLLLVAIDTWLGMRVLPDVPLDASAAGEVVRSILFVAIWVPYMLNSVRVKNTFSS